MRKDSVLNTGLVTITAAYHFNIHLQSHQPKHQQRHQPRHQQKLDKESLADYETMMKGSEEL